MRQAFLLILIAVSCLAETPEKPRCNSANHARFWPDEANGNPALMRKLAQSGELEICSYGTWKYKWVPVTRNVKRMLNRSGQSKSAQNSPNETPIEDNERRR